MGVGDRVEMRERDSEEMGEGKLQLSLWNLRQQIMFEISICPLEGFCAAPDSARQGSMLYVDWPPFLT